MTPAGISSPRTAGSRTSFADEYRGDGVSVQYKAGLYPGRWGEAALDFAEACGKPVLATLHSLRAAPEPGERDVVRRLAAACRRVVVMAGASGDLLRDVYDVPQDKVAYIPYGAHQPACCPKAWLRHRMALPSGPVLLTFGLVGPDKGIEHAIDALPEILACCPGALYVVAGRTHPGVKAREGESYRRQLQARADRLGITDHVIFEDRFMPLTEVFLHLKSADVYVSPHTARDRPASASLAYALAAGRAIVATPSPQAQEMAARGSLLLADFEDSRSLSANVLRILSNAKLRMELERNARKVGAQTGWRTVGEQYTRLFRAACHNDRPQARAGA